MVIKPYFQPTTQRRNGSIFQSIFSQKKSGGKISSLRCQPSASNSKLGWDIPSNRWEAWMVRLMVFYGFFCFFMMGNPGIFCWALSWVSELWYFRLIFRLISLKNPGESGKSWVFSFPRSVFLLIPSRCSFPRMSFCGFLNLEKWRSSMYRRLSFCKKMITWTLIFLQNLMSWGNRKPATAKISWRNSSKHGLK